MSLTQTGVNKERLAQLSDNLALTFVHPTSPSETLKVKVGLDATPDYIVKQLIANGFIRPPENAGQYKLRTDDGKQLLDDVAIATAGIVDGSHLYVESSMSGAGVRGR